MSEKVAFDKVISSKDITEAFSRIADDYNNHDFLDASGCVHYHVGRARLFCFKHKSYHEE